MSLSSVLDKNVDFLDVYERNEARYALLELVEELIQDSQIEEEFVEGFERAVKVFTTEDLDWVKGMNVRALIEFISAFIDQHVGKSRALKKIREGNMTEADITPQGRFTLQLDFTSK